ncbi:MAG: sugar transferase [Candidatus Saccharibacteria bacterium]
MKRSELLFNLLSILVDWLMIMLAGAAAFYLRFQLEEVRPILFDLSFSQYFRFLFLISPAIILFLAFSGLYNVRGTVRAGIFLRRIFFSVSAALLLVVVLFFFNQTIFPSRLIILMTLGLTIVFVSIGRIALRLIQIVLFKKGIGLHRLVVIDHSVESTGLIKDIQSRPALGYQVADVLTFDGSVENLIGRLESVRNEKGIDEMMQANSGLPDAVNQRLLDFCRDYGINFSFVPNLFETARTNVAVETISGIPVIVLKGTPLEGWGRVAKRLVDIAVSGIALIILSPLFLLTALAIKLNSRGPVFFHQPRAAGLGSFECYKFRSMYYEMSEGTPTGDRLRAEIEKQNARSGPFVKIKNDPRVTAVGKVIRKTKIDELPQLWHILRGQMSLVGPRVHMVKEVDHFRDSYKKIFTIKPGATGLTQVTQATDNPEISFEEEIRLDAFYIENWSLWLDFYIIFKTVLILLGKKPKVDY